MESLRQNNTPIKAMMTMMMMMMVKSDGDGPRETKLGAHWHQCSSPGKQSYFVIPQGKSWNIM